MIRKPSCFTSCSQRRPDGAAGAVIGRQGGMKPACNARSRGRAAAYISAPPIGLYSGGGGIATVGGRPGRNTEIKEAAALWGRAVWAWMGVGPAAPADRRGAPPPQSGYYNPPVEEGYAPPPPV